MAVANVNFPGSLDTSESLIQTANSSATTLSSNINPGATVLNVGSTITFPPSGTLVIEDEILYYTGKTLSSFTGVTRGAEGTTANSHSQGTEIAGQILASHHNTLAEAVIKTQTQIGPGAETIPQKLAALDARLSALETGGAPGAARPGFFRVADYGASGSRLKFSGTISAGALSTLTLASGADFAVDQGVAIPGAGTSGTLLVTKITALAGNVATLRNPAAAAVSSVQVQHDDTEAIQAAIQAAFDNAGGTVEFDYGFYRCNGPVRPETNSVLYIPYNQYGTEADQHSDNPHIPMRLVGQGPMLVPTHGDYVGTVLQSDRIGSSWESSILSCGIMDTGYGFWNLNFISLDIQYIVFQTYENTRLSGLDAGMAYNVTFKNLQIYAGVDQSLAIEPTHQHFGMRLPRYRYATVIYCEQVSIANFWWGLIVSEFMNANQVTIFSCRIGMQKEIGDHLVYGSLSLVHCATGIHFVDGGTVDFTISFEILSWPSKWNRFISNFDDPGNKARGRIGYLNFLYDDAGNFTNPPAVYTGCPNVVFFDYTTGEVKPRSLAATQTASAASLVVSGDTQLLGPLQIKSGTEVYNVSYGANSSESPGFRNIRIPDSSGVDLNLGLVSYWKLDESGGAARSDSVGSHHFTLVGPATSLTGGKIGQGFNPAPTNYLTTPDSSAFDFSASSFSITGWIYIYGIPAFQEVPSPLSKYSGTAGSCDWIVLYNGFANKWSFSVSPDGTTTNQVSAEILTAATLNTWYFVAAVYDRAAQVLKFSINNGTPSSVAFTANPFHSAHAVECGRFADDKIAFAAIDEIALYNRALAAAEITSLYNGGSGRTHPFS